MWLWVVNVFNLCLDASMDSKTFPLQVDQEITIYVSLSGAVENKMQFRGRSPARALSYRRA